MAITYAGMPFVRPAGVAKLPLILRNPQNDNTKVDYQKDGPSPVKKFGPSDYRMYFEMVTDQTGVLTNYTGYATSPDGYTWTKSASNPVITPRDNTTWEGGVQVPGSWLWDPYHGHWKMYTGGGTGVVGGGATGLWTSSTGLPGSWIEANGGNAIVVQGGAGADDEKSCGIIVVFLRGPRDYRAYAWVTKADGTVRTQYLTSLDGLSWTKVGIALNISAGTNQATKAAGAWGYEDELGRVHLWYCGTDSGGVTQRILYAYSDNWTTFTVTPSDVIAAASSTSTDPDYGGIGDVVWGWLDDGLLWFSMQNFNMSTYGGDALGRLEGRGLYWLPRKAATQPTRSGRCWRPITNARVNVPVAAKMLAQGTAFSIWFDFKMPPSNVYRMLYLESCDWNKEVHIGVSAAGKLEALYHAPSGVTATMGGASRVDDNTWHRLLFRRTGAAAFSVYVDGVSVGTDSTATGSDATALVALTIGGVDPADTNNAPGNGCGAIIRRVVTIAGYAMTDAEELTLWNSGNAGGAAPSSGTKQLDLLLGSGGQAGPDVDTSANAYGCTATNTEMVNAALSTDLWATARLLGPTGGVSDGGVV